MYEVIQQLCEKNNISITNLCLELTGSRGNLSTWKKGYMRSDVLAKIADYFNVTTDYLLGRAEQTAQINSNNTNSQIVSGDNNINTNNVINHLPDTEFDINEKKLIEKFRELDYEEQIGVLADVIGKTKR